MCCALCSARSWPLGRSCPAVNTDALGTEFWEWSADALLKIHSRLVASLEVVRVLTLCRMPRISLRRNTQGDGLPPFGAVCHIGEPGFFRHGHSSRYSVQLGFQLTL